MLIPEDLTRLQATMFVDGAALFVPNRGEIIHAAAVNMARGAVKKIVNDCVTTQDWLGHKGQTLYLDVYVLTPHELHALIMDAYIKGQKERARHEWDCKTSLGEAE